MWFIYSFEGSSMVRAEKGKKARKDRIKRIMIE